MIRENHCDMSVSRHDTACTMSRSRVNYSAVRFIIALRFCFFGDSASRRSICQNRTL